MELSPVSFVTCSILATTIQYSFIVWLADHNHIKAQNEKVNIAYGKICLKAERYIVFSDVMIMVSKRYDATVYV